MNEKDAVFEVALSLWRQKWVALIVFVLCAIPPVLWVVQLADDYTANATVHIAPMPGLDPDNRSTQHVYIDQVSLKTEVDVLRSEPLALAVIERLDLLHSDAFAPSEPNGLRALFAGLRSADSVDAPEATGDQPDQDARDTVLKQYLSHLNVANDGRSALAVISFSIGSPEVAREIANAHAEAYIESRSLRRLDPYQASTARFVAPARLPAGAKPKSAKSGLMAGLGLAVLASIAVALLKDRRITRHLRLRPLAEQLNLRPLVSLPTERSSQKAPSGGRRRTLFDERIKTLARVLSEDNPGTGSVFAVTSAGSEEGAPLVAAHLAKAFATLGFSTCIVDADLRDEGVKRYLTFDGDAAGVADLMGTHFIVPEHKSSASNLRFIPAGERRMEALNRMTRQQFTAMIESVRRSFDVVVISAPPISPVADALLSVPDATATALIIQSDHRDSLAAGALQQLRERNTTLAGLVLTGADPDIHDTMQDRRFRIALADKPAQRGADVVECEPLITKPTGNKATDAPGDQRKLRSRIGAAI